MRLAKAVKANSGTLQKKQEKALQSTKSRRAIKNDEIVDCPEPEASPLEAGFLRTSHL
jgi:hypothetical protein